MRVREEQAMRVGECKRCVSAKSKRRSAGGNQDGKPQSTKKSRAIVDGERVQRGDQVGLDDALFLVAKRRRATSVEEEGRRDGERAR